MPNKEQENRILENKVLEWNKNISFLKYKNRVIIANRYNGSWLKISKECFDILEKVIDSKILYNEVLEIFREKEDKDYFERLLNKLNEINSFKGNEVNTANKIECVYFSLTHRCNLKCTHCSVDASSIYEEEYLDTSKILDVIDKILKTKLKVIIFTGGEALLRDDFNTILEYTRKNFSGKITLMTNATLINNKNVELLTKNLDSIDISIDGVNEETCSKVRGNGVFEKVINAVKLLKQHNFNKISLSMVLSIYNEPLLGEFYELNKNLGTIPMKRVFAERGRGKYSKDEFVSPPKLLSSSKVKTKEEYEKDKKELYNTIRVCACGANKTTVTINYDGNIYPCGLLMSDEYKLLNIKDIENLNTLKDYSNLEAKCNFEHIQPEKYGECKDCEVNIFCWSCLEAIDQLKGKKEFNDRCKSIKEYLIETIWESEYE